MPKYTMSEKAKEQRKKNAERLRMLIQKAKAQGENDLEEEEEVVKLEDAPTSGTNGGNVDLELRTKLEQLEKKIAEKEALSEKRKAERAARLEEKKAQAEERLAQAEEKAKEKKKKDELLKTLQEDLENRLKSRRIYHNILDTKLVTAANACRW